MGRKTQFGIGFGILSFIFGLPGHLEDYEWWKRTVKSMLDTNVDFLSIISSRIFSNIAFTLSVLLFLYGTSPLWMKLVPRRKRKDLNNFKGLYPKIKEATDILEGFVHAAFGGTLTPTLFQRERE